MPKKTPSSIPVSIQTEAGKWYRFDSEELNECCDCSMIHHVEYRFEKGRMFWRARVDRRATNAKRRANGITILRQPPEIT